MKDIPTREVQRIDGIEFFCFRNIRNQKAVFDKDIVYFVGANGQGKTNILEAIFLLSHAKSFRNSTPREFVSHANRETSNAICDESNIHVDAFGNDCCSIVGKIKSFDSHKCIRFEVRDGERRVFIDGNRVDRASDFYGRFVCLAFTPDDVELVRGAPATRRRFVDLSISMYESSYAREIANYQRALKQRNALLQAGKREKLRSADVRDEIKAWDEPIINIGLEIAKKRRDYILELESKSKKHFEKFGVENSENMSLSYICHFENMSYDALRERLERNLDRELRYGSTLIGIHRDDLKISLETHGNPCEAKRFASQGQARSIALSLVMGALEVLESRTGETPVLLLDDVDSELDSTRREVLYDSLRERSGQVFITATQCNFVNDIGADEARLYRVSNGEILGE